MSTMAQPRTRCFKNKGSVSDQGEVTVVCNTFATPSQRHLPLQLLSFTVISLPLLLLNLDLPAGYTASTPTVPENLYMAHYKKVVQLIKIKVDICFQPYHK